VGPFEPEALDYLITFGDQVERRQVPVGEEAHVIL
jgi:hypothetical protein